MRVYLAIAVGGVFGCWARYAMTNLVQSIYGRDFPYATLSINVLGAFLMGFLFIETLERLTVPPYVRIGVLTGVIGGFTTFSTYAMETLLLAEQGEVAKAFCTSLSRTPLALGRRCWARISPVPFDQGRIAVGIRGDGRSHLSERSGSRASQDPDAGDSEHSA